MYRHAYPSKEFADKTRVKNIYTEWKINFFIPYLYELQYYCCFSSSIITYIMYRIMISDNKQLGLIKANTARLKLNVIVGAISKYTFEDIKYFVENYDSIISYNMNCIPKYEQIERKFGIRAEWVMSPETLSYVHGLI